MSYYYGKQSGGTPYGQYGGYGGARGMGGGYRYPGSQARSYPGYRPGSQAVGSPYGVGRGQQRPQGGYQGMGQFQMPPEMQAMYQRFAGGGFMPPYSPPGGGGGGEGYPGGGASGGGIGQPGYITPEWSGYGGQRQMGGMKLQQITNPRTGKYEWVDTATGRIIGYKGEGEAGGGGGGGGMVDITTDRYAYPEDIQNLMGRLGERGEEFLSMRPGYADAAMKGMFGQEYDTLRQAGQAAQQSALEGLQAGGQLGTGQQADLAQQMAWGQQQNVGNLMRDIAIRGEEQKREDLYGYTQAAQGLTGQLGEMRLGEEGAARMREQLGLQAEMGRGQLRLGQGQLGQENFRNLMAYQQMMEQMNMMRRGEGRDAFMDWMRYMGMNM